MNQDFWPGCREETAEALRVAPTTTEDWELEFIPVRDASLLIAQGEDLPTVATQMRHADPGRR